MMLGLDTSALIALEMSDHPDHARIASVAQAERDAGGRFALTAQIMSEFIHVGTDPRRFTTPFSMELALDRAHWWFLANDVDVLAVDPDAFRQFTDWMRVHRLGRKRILDTLLAATFKSHGVRRIVTLNPDDFRVFGEFEFVA